MSDPDATVAKELPDAPRRDGSDAARDAYEAALCEERRRRI